MCSRGQRANSAGNVGSASVYGETLKIEVAASLYVTGLLLTGHSLMLLVTVLVMLRLMLKIR